MPSPSSAPSPGQGQACTDQVSSNSGTADSSGCWTGLGVHGQGGQEGVGSPHREEAQPCPRVKGSKSSPAHLEPLSKIGVPHQPPVLCLPHLSFNCSGKWGCRGYAETGGYRVQAGSRAWNGGHSSLLELLESEPVWWKHWVPAGQDLVGVNIRCHCHWSSLQLNGNYNGV